MTSNLYRFPKARWGQLRVFAAVFAAVLLSPFLLVAVLPMLVMFVPIAVIAIPVIAPMMLTGKLTARWEVAQRAARENAVPSIKRAPVVAR